MSPDLKVIEGAYLGDILNQPQALENTLATLGSSKELQSLAVRLGKGNFQRVVLTGMGSSFHALHPLNLQLIRHGHTAVMVETSELVHYKNRFFDSQDADCCCVAVRPKCGDGAIDRHESQAFRRDRGDQYT